MGEQEVKVLGTWGSPFSKRVEMALKLKGVSYDYKEEDVYFNKSDELVKYNPIYKKVPVLIHKGKALAESQVILEYIDEAWNQHYPILPLHPYQKARARFLAKFIDDKCLPSLWQTLWATNDEHKQVALKEANENLRILEKELQGNKFFGGEAIGFVDIVANFIGFWLGSVQEVVGMEILTRENYPLLFNWAQEFARCNIIMESLPPRDQLIAFFKTRFEAAKVSK